MVAPDGLSQVGTIVREAITREDAGSSQRPVDLPTSPVLVGGFVVSSTDGTEGGGLPLVAAAADAPAVSVIVPGLNEAESLAELARRVGAALDPVCRYELIFVDDGSTDDSWQRIQALHATNPNVRGVCLRGNFGKAMALTAGFRVARAPVLMMMDADLQDDPGDLPRFLDKLHEGFDVVVGWKVKRQDPLNRRLLSRLFNRTVSWLTHVELHDMNCGFKAYRREVIETVPIYGDMFRFIPALAAAQGFRISEIPITHHSRKYGRSRYGLERVLRGIFDLASVLFLIRYSRRPMHLFGLLGLMLGGGGILINLYLTVLWFRGVGIGSRPLLLLGVLMTITGVQFASLGLLGEFLAYQGQKRGYRDALPVRDRVGF
jgi:glycosyltransferase involved in cell wall biosynthesis